MSLTGMTKSPPGNQGSRIYTCRSSYISMHMYVSAESYFQPQNFWAIPKIVEKRNKMERSSLIVHSNNNLILHVKMYSQEFMALFQKYQVIQIVHQNHIPNRNTKQGFYIFL